MANFLSGATPSPRALLLLPIPPFAVGSRRSPQGSPSSFSISLAHRSPSTSRRKRRVWRPTTRRAASATGCRWWSRVAPLLIMVIVAHAVIQQSSKMIVSFGRLHAPRPLTHGPETLARSFFLASAQTTTNRELPGSPVVVTPPRYSPTRGLPLSSASPTPHPLAGMIPMRRRAPPAGTEPSPRAVSSPPPCWGITRAATATRGLRNSASSMPLGRVL